MWLHAKDTAEAVITIIESGKTNEIYNVSGNFEQKNIDTVNKILDLYSEEFVNYDRENLFDFTYGRDGQDVRYSVDDSKLQALGWKPQCNFDDELPDIVEFYRKNFIW